MDGFPKSGHIWPHHLTIFLEASVLASTIFIGCNINAFDFSKRFSIGKHLIPYFFWMKFLQYNCCYSQFCCFCKIGFSVLWLLWQKIRSYIKSNLQRNLQLAAKNIPLIQELTKKNWISVIGMLIQLHNFIASEIVLPDPLPLFKDLWCSASSNVWQKIFEGENLANPVHKFSDPKFSFNRKYNYVKPLTIVIATFYWMKILDLATCAKWVYVVEVFSSINKSVPTGGTHCLNSKHVLHHQQNCNS